MLFTVKGSAAAAKVSPSKIRNLLRRGDLPRIRIGRCVRIAETDLKKYIDEHRSTERAS